MSGIIFLITGCQWKSLPKFYGAASTVYDRLCESQKAGLFENMWKAGLLDYDAERGLEFD